MSTSAANPPTERLAPSLRALLVLAWPVVVSRSTQVVIGLSDGLMVAHLGERAVAATITGAFDAWALFILPAGIVSVVASFASQLMGAGDLIGARRYAWYGLAVAVATQVACVAAIPALGPVLSLAPFEPEVQSLMAGYLTFRLLSGGASIGLEALGNYYGGLGDTVRPMIANLFAMALNVFGNWLLIDGVGPFPALGVEGAAIASSIATWIVFAGLFGVFLSGGGPGTSLAWHELRRLLQVGLPSGLNWFFEFMAFNVFVNLVVGALGTTTLAAFMAVLQVNSFSFQPGFAVASAGSILVGQAIGAGHKDDVPRTVALTAGVVAAWQLAVSVAYVAVPMWLMSPFANDEARAAGFLVVGARMLRWSAAWQLFDGLAMTLGEALRAAGDTTFAMWARVVIAWGLFTPGAWFTVRVLGAGDGAAVAWVVAYLMALSLVLYLRFRGGAWRRITLVEAPLVEAAPSAGA